MSSEWPTTTLGSLTNWLSGGTPKKDVPSYWGGEIPWISASSMEGTQYSNSDLKITQEGLINGSKIAPKDSVLLLVRGSALHKKIPVGIATRDLAFNQDVKAISPKNKNLLPKYLLYWLMAQKDYFLESVVEFTGIGAGKLDTKRLQALPIYLPPVTEQVEIVNFVGAIDDRITLLRETNTTLEAIAQALFKSWFVDFDPVHAKQQGRAPEGMDAQTAALFPDAFEDSELGMVPKGWRVGTIADICSTISNGSTPSRSKAVFWENGNIPWFKTGELSDGFLINSSEFITHEALSGSSVKILPKLAVLMAIYAAPTVGRLGILTEEATFNQACTGMVAKENIGPWFLFWTLFNGRDWFNSRANGAAQQNISKAIVATYELVIPNQQALDAFNRVATSLHESILLNSEQASTLSKLRDTLLPRLISGQLRLPEAQALVDDAVDA